MRFISASLTKYCIIFESNVTITLIVRKRIWLD